MRRYNPSQRSYNAPVSGGGIMRKGLVLFLVGGLSWLLWTTRDNWPMERLVPGDQTFHLRAQDLLDTRREAASSAFWSLGVLPEKYRDIPQWLNNDFGLPQWVLNNLVTDECYVSGTDLVNFSDLLVVTRMSRIGCLLERYYGIADDVEVEYAGGLDLRRIGAASHTYYAVRGRTLVFSPSREALIRALTLTEAGGVEKLEETVAPMAGDLQGRITFGESDGLGQYFQQSDFGLRFEPDAIIFSSRSAMTPPWKSHLDRVVAGQHRRDLMVPTYGSLVLAGDFNMPLPQLWTSVDEMTEGALSGYWSDLPWVRGAGAADSAWAAMLESMKTGVGSGFSLRWTGFDYNGIVPVPETELFLETRAGFAPQLVKSVPTLPPGQAPTDFVPYRVAESGVIRCPTGWGNVYEPTVFAEDSGLRVTLHPQHMEHALVLDKTREAAPGDGLLYMRIRPVELIELLHEGGMPYAHSGLLRGQTVETFEAAMAQALAGSRQISEVRVAAGYEQGSLNVEAVVLLTAEPGEKQHASDTAVE